MTFAVKALREDDRSGAVHCVLDLAHSGVALLALSQRQQRLDELATIAVPCQQ